MAVTGTKTVRQIVTRALRKADVLALGEEPDADMVDAAMEDLDAMLKSWQGQPWVWTRTAGTLSLTTSASYTLSPVRPVRILSARLKRGGIETPMQAMTRTEYDELPLKTSAGLPTSFFYDRQREAAVFYVWPVLAAANGETVAYTYTREIEDVTDLNAVLDCPAEWYDAVVMNLAASVAFDYARPKAEKLKGLGLAALQDAIAAEMDEPVHFEAGA